MIGRPLTLEGHPWNARKSSAVVETGDIELLTPFASMRLQAPHDIFRAAD